MSEPPEYSSLDAFAAAKLARLRADNLHRTLEATQREAGARVTRAGRELVSFCCNDYLGLSQHPRVIEAAVEATRKFGAGAGASRFVTGNHPLYAALEHALARFKDYAGAVVFGSGYLTNLGVIPCLAGPDDLIVMDELNHACLFAGTRLSRAVFATFPHADLEACAAVLEQQRDRHPRALIISDGVFSMDGDRADVAGLAELAERYDAWLLIDDAHGFGVLNGGRGSAAIAQHRRRVPLNMGTLSKAVGSYGGYLCASAAVIDLLRNRGRSLIYTTGLPPGTVAAATTALAIIASDPARVALPLQRATQFCRLLDLPAPASCIVPLIIGPVEQTLTLSAALEQRGFLVTAIRPPTVPENTARLRFTFTAMHDEEQVQQLADTVAELIDA